MFSLPVWSRACLVMGFQTRLDTLEKGLHLSSQAVWHIPHLPETFPCCIPQSRGALQRRSAKISQVPALYGLMEAMAEASRLAKTWDHILATISNTPRFGNIYRKHDARYTLQSGAD